MRAGAIPILFCSVRACLRCSEANAVPPPYVSLDLEKKSRARNDNSAVQQLHRLSVISGRGLPCHRKSSFWDLICRTAAPRITVRQSTGCCFVPGMADGATVAFSRHFLSLKAPREFSLLLRARTDKKVIQL